MSYLSYPSISMARAAAILADVSAERVEDLRDRAGRPHPYVEPALGATPAPNEVMEKLSESIRQLAIDNGYPEARSRSGIRHFDRPAGALLHDMMRISPADAAKPEVWNFVTLILLPDVAAWRFPTRESYRMMGAGYGETKSRSGRNAFGRLWWATEVLGYEATLEAADAAGEPLGEDEVVSIMERTAAIAPSALIARTIAGHGRKFFSANQGKLDLSRMNFFRELAKEITRLRALYNISALPEDQVQEFVNEACGRVLAENRGEASPQI